MVNGPDHAAAVFTDRARDPVITDKSVKVPYSSRLSAAADRQLKELGREGGQSQVDLLSEAVNLLFKKYGFDELA